jgi:mRNA interferase MazF
MKEGDIVLTPVPQANGLIKNRPAVFLRELPRYRDLLVCGISTQLRQRIADFDELVSPGDADFAGSGLQAESLIRLSFLAVLPVGRVIGSIGSISVARHRRLLSTLSEYLTR